MGEKAKSKHPLTGIHVTGCGWGAAVFLKMVPYLSVETLSLISDVSLADPYYVAGKEKEQKWKVDDSENEALKNHAQELLNKITEAQEAMQKAHLERWNEVIAFGQRYFEFDALTELIRKWVSLTENEIKLWPERELWPELEKLGVSVDRNDPRWKTEDIFLRSELIRELVSTIEIARGGCVSQYEWLEARKLLNRQRLGHTL